MFQKGFRLIFNYLIFLLSSENSLTIAIIYLKHGTQMPLRIFTLFTKQLTHRKNLCIGSKRLILKLVQLYSVVQVSPSASCALSKLRDRRAHALRREPSRCIIFTALLSCVGVYLWKLVWTPGSLHSILLLYVVYHTVYLA